MSLIGNLWDKLTGTVGDLTTLDVVTATGTIKVDKYLKNERVDMSALMGDLKKVDAGGGEANMNVLAISHLEFDCDAYVFVKDNLSDSEQALIKAHVEMVKAAQETRFGVVKMALELFNKKPPANLLGSKPAGLS